MALTNNKRIQLKLVKSGSSAFTIKAADGDVLSQNSTIVFFTVATPMYTTVDAVYLAGGDVVEELPEIAIWQMIYSSSTKIDDMLLFDPNVKFTDQSTTNQNWVFFRRARAEFVKCMAIRDTLRAALSSRGMSAGRRTLADFTIDLSGQANLISQARSFANDMASECRYWLDAIYSGGAADFQNLSPGSAVKSGSVSGQGNIGRGWIVGGSTMNSREGSQQGTLNNSSRPRRRGNF